MTTHLRVAQMLKMSTAIPLPPSLYTFIVQTGTSPLIYLYIHGEVYPEDGGGTFLRNISKCLQAYTNSQAIVTALTALVLPRIYVAQYEIQQCVEVSALSIGHRPTSEHNPTSSTQIFKIM